MRQIEDAKEKMPIHNGAKRINRLYKQLGITGLADLNKALDAGTIRQLAGFGEKTEQNLREEVARLGNTSAARKNRIRGL